MNCRHCAAELRLPVLDLGVAPPSNAYLSASDLRQPESFFPLRLMVCESCWLVQTEDHTGRNELFTESYAYFSSFSTSWLEHAHRYVQSAIDRFDLDVSSRVIEVAANDGYLLQYVQAAGISCLGIEPTTSTANAARKKGLHVIERFFGKELADELLSDGQAADLMIANNVLAHVPDINDFVSGFAHLLKADGVATFEFPHLLRMVEENQFDTAYHEHYSYLSLIAVERIFARNGLMIFDVEELPTHGGSLRVYAQRLDCGCRLADRRVADLLQIERASGMADTAFYAGFQARAEQAKNDLMAFLIESKKLKLKVGAYGAAAKGNTLLNFAGVRSDLLSYVVDRNPAKQGQFMPGSHIPIVDEAVLKAHQPDWILILPWNLRQEIMGQLSYVKGWGGRLLTAIPELTFMDVSD